MKKIIAVTVAVLMVLGIMSACSTPPAPTQSDTPQTSADEPTAAQPASSEDGAELAQAVASGQFPVTGSGRQCSTTVKASKDYQIACIVKNNTNPACMGWLNGVKKGCEDMGCTAVLMTPSVNDSVDEQISIIEDMIQKGIEGIAIAPVDSNGIMPGAREAHDAGIPVASLTTPCAQYDLAFVGPNFYDTGYTAAKAVAEKLGGEGEVIILEGPPGAQNAIDRLHGIEDAFAEYPGITIDASQTGNFKRTEGMQVTENLIQKYTDVDAIIGMNDEMALGAIQALKGANMNDVVVIGFDCNEDASNAILNGDMWGSFNMDHFGIGYAAAVSLIMNLDYGIVPPDNKVVFPGATVNQIITKDSIQEYMDKMSWY